MKIITVGILILCFVIPVQLQDMERRKSHSLYFGHSSHLQSVFIGCFLFIRCLLWGLPNSSTRYVDVFSLTWSKSELKLLEVIHVSTYSISCEILTFFSYKECKGVYFALPRDWNGHEGSSSWKQTKISGESNQWGCVRENSTKQTRLSRQT